MHSVFSIEGPVVQVETKQSKKGTPGVILLVKVSEYQGKAKFREISVWGDRASMARGVQQGDIISASGTITSEPNQSGYMNDNVFVQSLVVLKKAQQGAGLQQQQDVGFQQQQNAYAEQQAQQYDTSDIPF